MQHVFPAARSGRRHLHSLHRRFPLLAGDDAAAMRTEADQDHTIVFVLFPDQLAHVDHAVIGHVGVTCVADVRVVFPHDRLGLWTVMLHEPLERLHHVPVANVPRFGAAADHGAVVVLGVLHHQGILLGVEVPILSVTGKRLGRAAEFGEQLHHMAFTRRIRPLRRPRVFLDVLAIRLEALKGATGGRESIGKMFAKVSEHVIQRIPEAVDIQAVEADSLLTGPVVVVLPEPANKLADLAVGPHPGRPAIELAQHLCGALASIAVTFDKPVDAVAVGPVAFDGDERKLFSSIKRRLSAVRQV